MFSKVLSDDKAVRRAAISYFGKILTETNADLTRGITKDITTKFVEAYVLAANDFMHKSNFMHKIEDVIRMKFGNVGYFAYKQFE